MPDLAPGKRKGEGQLRRSFPRTVVVSRTKHFMAITTLFYMCALCSTYIYMYVCMHVCMYVYVYIIFTSVFISLYIYIYMLNMNVVYIYIAHTYSIYVKNQHPLTTSVVPVYICATSWINKALSLCVPTVQKVRTATGAKECQHQLPWFSHGCGAVILEASRWAPTTTTGATLGSSPTQTTSAKEAGLIPAKHTVGDSQQQGWQRHMT